MQMVDAIEVERSVRIAGRALAAGMHEVEIQRGLLGGSIWLHTVFCRLQAGQRCQ
jgi:hypothetical protein